MSRFNDLRRGLCARALAGAVALSAFAAAHPGLAGPKPPAPDDALAAGFVSPPPGARPLVYWRWMNGDISSVGLDLDLQWMKRVGIGGTQLVEAAPVTPTVVDGRLPFLSPGWADAVRYAAETSDRLGLEMSIADSPGRSGSGAPWVTPAQAMKELVWSTTTVAGGRRFVGRLPAPPASAGPFQDVPAGDGSPDAYVDAAVLAFPTPDGAANAPSAKVSSSGGRIDAARLSDGLIGPTQDLPIGDDGSAWIRFEYRRPVTLRSVSIGLPGRRGFGAPPPPEAELQVSEDGKTFRPVVELPRSPATQRTATFPPVTGRVFRVVLRPGESAPGAETPPGVTGPPPTAYAVSELVLSPVARVRHFEEKAGFSTALDYDALATPTADAASTVDPRRVLDLTARLRPDGSLDWAPPKGRWTILRLGYSLTGRRNGPAEAEATGLGVDKLSRPAVRAYMDRYLGVYADAVGPSLMGAHGITGLLSDRIEAGPQNWTDDMAAQFKRLRGYDITPWLPALTGVIVGDSASTDRFLWDFRRTIADLFADSRYAQAAESAHQRGLIYYAEALEDHRPQLGDEMDMRAPADVPMGAMGLIPADGEPRQTSVTDLLGAASVAHVYGRPVAAAESPTVDGRPWDLSPAELKSSLDLEFALGINRIVIHSSTHQPLAGKTPGLAHAPVPGTDFNRNQTWAEQAGAVVDYMSRSAFMLQQGRFVADVAYFCGEAAPLTALFGDGPPKDAPTGYGFDFVNADILLRQLSVDQGMLVTPGGARYRLLYLGGSSRRMTLPVLLKLKDLVAQGAVVVGEEPVASPSKADDPARFKALAHRLWLGSDQPAAINLGAGRILSGRTVNRALEELGLPPDVEWRGGGSDTRIMSLHRHLPDGDVYFISNRTRRAETVDGVFRVSGKAPEFWRADTGGVEPAPYVIKDGRTTTSVTLGPDDAVFVVFRRPAEAPALQAPAKVEKRIATLAGPWSVSFQPGRGGPARIAMDTLAPLTDQGDPGVRYFSGTAAYSISVDVGRDEFKSGSRLVLDLGDLSDVAEVLVNGRPAGTVWKTPYRLDLTSALRPGPNRLEVRVTNPWRNRLIGDAQPDAKPVTSTQGPTYAADAPLRRSGLIGPVRLLRITTQH